VQNSWNMEIMYQAHFNKDNKEITNNSKVKVRRRRVQIPFTISIIYNLIDQRERSSRIRNIETSYIDYCISHVFNDFTLLNLIICYNYEHQIFLYFLGQSNFAI